MASNNRTPSEQELAATVASLPANPAQWTPEQTADYAAKSNRVMEENATKPGER
ncbi:MULTISPECIES: hypothetical protein [unclassified Streptomyces]|uniref:hypothetical protein n=1 Tax=unclassified Streptomyces TaxID=2593676 RepID=UPI002E196E1D|nr:MULTISPECIES: hypothetical protein [unclassified Streptomyces]